MSDPSEGRRRLETYRTLVAKGWVADALGYKKEKKEAEMSCAVWSAWLHERAAADGLRLRTDLVFGNLVRTWFKYELRIGSAIVRSGGEPAEGEWLAVAALLGLNGEPIQPGPLFSQLDRSPEAIKLRRLAVQEALGPTLRAARSQVARDLIRDGSAEDHLRWAQQKTAYPTLPPRGVHYCSACCRYSWARDWDYQDEGTNWRGEACPCCGTWRALGPKPYECGPLRNQSDAEQEAAADEWRRVPQ